MAEASSPYIPVKSSLRMLVDDAEAALRTALSLSEYPASVCRSFFTLDTAIAQVTKILLREAEPEIPF